MPDEQIERDRYKSIAVKLAAFCCRLYVREDIQESVAREAIKLAHEFKDVERHLAITAQYICPHCGNDHFDHPCDVLTLTCSGCGKTSPTDECRRKLNAAEPAGDAARLRQTIDSNCRDLAHMDRLLTECRQQLAAAIEERDRLREAIHPFAMFSGTFGKKDNGGCSDHGVAISRYHQSLTVGAFRRAESALSHQEPAQ
jgi:hypothetical protein